MDIGKVLALNLRQLRKQSNYSQQKLSDKSGLPRSTIANIESESGNPSLSNLVKLAAALQVNVDELLSMPVSDSLLIQSSKVPVVEKSGGRAKVYKLLPEPIQGMEFDRVILSPGCRMRGIPHTIDTKEYLILLKGRITVHVQEEIFHVRTGDVLSFPGDRAHSYFNEHHTDAHFISVVALSPRYSNRR